MNVVHYPRFLFPKGYVTKSSSIAVSCGRSTSASGCATLFLIEINGGAGRQDEDVVHMVNERMYGLGAEPSAIRELFAYGMVRKAEIGAENVFDFSIGNPSVPAPMP